MASTTWQLQPALNLRSWLFADGQVMVEPQLEESGSGQKVRLPGTKISAYKKDMDDLIVKALQTQAAMSGTKVWMPLDDREDNLRAELGFNPAAPEYRRADLHFTTPGNTETVLWWKFKHPTMPVEAVMSIRVKDRRASTGTRPQDIVGTLVYPWTWAGQDQTQTQYVAERDPRFGQTVNEAYSSVSVQNALTSLIGEGCETSAAYKGVLGATFHNGQRAATEALLGLVRQVDELERVFIPNLNDLNNPTWLELELIDTNVGDFFIQELLDFLDGGPTVAKAVELYEELIGTIRALGFVFERKEENFFLEALRSGDKAAFTVKVSDLAEVDNKTDAVHTLHMHLPTGTFVVSCGATMAEHTVHAWEEAHLVASLSGKEDTLLAYAREHLDKQDKPRVRRIMKERNPGSA